uniref:PB1 domain-containing protein n=1 Tax=Romanomermis culicivorax TaxID=13658 RepID=A0A915K2M4_ROMCU
MSIDKAIYEMDYRLMQLHMSVATKPYYAPSQTSSGSSGGGGIRGSIKSSGSGVNSKFRSSLSNPLSQNNNNCRKSAALSMTCDDLIEIKSKFDAEFRRFSISRSSCIHDMKSFRKLVENLHNLTNVPFTLCYTDMHGDLLPINNDENFKKALESARPVLRMLVQRKGESLEERYGYGTTDSLKKRNRISRFLGNVGAGGLVPVVGGAASLLIAAAPPRQYDISMPQDFRQVSAIIDVDVVPETHRRVRLCKHGSDKPLGFYIRDGTSVRVTSQVQTKLDFLTMLEFLAYKFKATLWKFLFNRGIKNLFQRCLSIGIRNYKIFEHVTARSAASKWD